MTMHELAVPIKPASISGPIILTKFCEEYPEYPPKFKVDDDITLYSSDNWLHYAKVKQVFWDVEGLEPNYCILLLDYISESETIKE